MANLLKITFMMISILKAEGVQDLGTHGPLFDIGEENMIDFLQNKLKKIEREGGLETLQETWKQKIVEGLKRPKAVDGITRTTTLKQWRVDPTLVIENDIVTPNGKILAKKGDKINPLHHVMPPKGFLFINADDQDQVIFSKKYLEKFDLILVKGSPLDLQDELKVPVYFDQGGYLTKKYNITHVPAFIKIGKETLVIEEVVIDE